MKTFPKSERMRLLALIHIAKKKAIEGGHFRDDDDYRSFLDECTGKRSAADMSPAELMEILKEFERQGWVRDFQNSPRSRHKTEKTQADKCVALWITLYQQGIVRNGSHQSLGRFVQRYFGKNLRVMPGVDPLDAATPRQLSAVIVALEAMGNGSSSPA